MSLCRQHYHDELQLQLCHEASLCVMLERLAASHRDHMMTSLDGIHHRQEQQLKREMDVGNKDELKMLAVKYTDKQELARYHLQTFSASSPRLCLVLRYASSHALHLVPSLLGMRYRPKTRPCLQPVPPAMPVPCSKACVTSVVFHENSSVTFN